MTALLKMKILEAINEATGCEIPSCKIIDAANRVEELVDEAMAKALADGCNFGDILEAVGLQIVGIN